MTAEQFAQGLSKFLTDSQKIPPFLPEIKRGEDIR
ncbi:hypothetical protein MiTa_03880 [Microcystis aeruginosa NIES-4264]|nr:hypothetical protein MiTa_03880 [Microcystis aeruginosa NIES-4264]